MPGSGDAMATWADIQNLPLSEVQGISAAVELRLFEKPVGVISVFIALKCTSKLLDELEVGNAGSLGLRTCARSEPRQVDAAATMGNQRH